MAGNLKPLLDAFDATLPLERAKTISAPWYTDPGVYRAECRTLFRNAWQAAGRTTTVCQPGSFFTTDLAGLPVAVVRDERGELRAFANVCRHRAARVVCQAEGTASRFRCPYHGWTYDLAGRLRGVPEFDGVADFHRQQEHLPVLTVDTWGPFVWVFPGQPSVSLAEWLKPVPAMLTDFALESLQFAERREYVVECNWKVFVDNYLDGGYHVNSIHPGLAGVLDYAHYRTEVFSRTSIQSSPLCPGGSAGEGSYTGKVRTGGTAAYAWVFPNFMINVYQGVMDTNLVLPLGPNRCRVVFDFFFADTETPAARSFIAQSVDVAERIQKEDMTICEDVQRGLASGTFDTGRYSVRREAGVYHFHRLLAAELRNAISL